MATSLPKSSNKHMEEPQTAVSALLGLISVAMIATINKCTTCTTQSMSRIVSMHRYTLTSVHERSSLQQALLEPYHCISIDLQSSYTI